MLLRRSLARAAWLLAAALATSPAHATWSIVVVDTATGEVCVAGATCLVGLSLRDNLAVVRPGIGGAAAQSFVDVSGQNRQRIWDGLGAGLSPQEILDDLAANDAAHQTRQYNIVDFTNDPVFFSGSGAGFAKKGLAATPGTLRYAMSGNLLAGQKVITEARKTLLDDFAFYVPRLVRKP